MFGSKLRSWMETHIGRTRKKGNKHKQAAAAAASAGDSNIHGKKSGTLPATSSNLTSPVLTSSGSHSIASPVRRREVSPIQCHTPSRYGWQSPTDQDSHTITSPKSDNLLYAPHHHHNHRYQQQLSVPLGKDNYNGDKSPIRVNCSSSSISSLSWSTGSKEPSSAAGRQNSYNYPQHQQSQSQQQHHQEEEVHHIKAEDEVEYEEVGSVIFRPLMDYPRPQSENLQLIYDEAEAKENSRNSNYVHYGRLLPSKLAPVQLGESVESLPPPPPPPAPAFSNQNAMAKTTSSNCRLRGNSRGMPRNNFMPGPPRPHSLSSPESAYSTGYSTDGTSPCAASNYNPPEYYINMRTGTHYFPKSVNSLAIEAKRYKFGLNRIEEMSPMDPLPKSNFANSANANGNCCLLEPSPRQGPRLFESPSPRQRCRIRTNPWYNTNEQQQQQHLAANSGNLRNLELDATSTTSSNMTTTSSGIKSGNEVEISATKKMAAANSASEMPEVAGVGVAVGVGVTYESSEGSSSSSTEVENLHALMHTMKRRHMEQGDIITTTTTTSATAAPIVGVAQLSDDEATLNEMIGKFDESYIYEKETDILSSDSDPTDCCASELDTGQDAGDECDTDELLDIDFIDTSSMQEVMLLDQRNLGSCHYYPNQAEPSPLVLRRSSTRSRRRKRFLKTRKKSCENRERLPEVSPMREPRGTRSVGGTPVCLRRHLMVKERIYKTSPLSNRSNSLIFGSINDKNFMTIAESEKALLKADLEADMKYKQLIMEAESLLESMKNSLQSIPRDTPVASPRRLNPLANKRVEMLKNSEVETKKQAPPSVPAPASPQEHELAAAINKRIELLKLETSMSGPSPPNSPKMNRCSPRKTHLTNFMNQNNPPELPPRKINQAPPLSPQLQLNGRRLKGNEDVEEKLASQSNNFYCPHSEPLKRKVYKGSSSFERIKKTFDLELGDGERRKSKGSQSKLLASSVSVSAKSSMQDMTGTGEDCSTKGENHKQQLLLSTIVDLKRSLEHQSYQLNGLNVD
ncbi:uncharacterized protein Dwil_GK20893 [Drosophila willistoni]|uniref:Uncharacterized protein n=1 Tax=Drosophila willistoni TaxID=7260 RepID=B4MJT6_DROWI|nr:uncharacterized protein LOC6638492 isoform X1 [Drosophila willistoni]EDW72375.1 uncharacterized protein Dwil_GK20893 [Drosophila willistoni]